MTLTSDSCHSCLITGAGSAGDEFGEVTASEELPGGDRGPGQTGGC